MSANCKVDNKEPNQHQSVKITIIKMIFKYSSYHGYKLITAKKRLKRHSSQLEVGIYNEHPKFRIQWP